MNSNTKLDPQTTAILSLDCQNGIVSLVTGAEKILGQASRVLQAAREKGFPILHVGIGFRPGYPEVSPDHPTFGRIRDMGKFIVGTESAQFHSAVAPKDGEITVIKHRVSAFSGNDLEMILRARRISHLVLFGIATSGIVLSTLRQAVDLDFRCTVLEDCCFDSDEEVHRVLTGKVFARQAEVMTADAFLAKLA
jgi:nicotinamidase-related amidase